MTMMATENPEIEEEKSEETLKILHLCDMCKDVASKYKCPACEMKTCSLSCVKRHKEEFECNGVRDKTKFVPVKEFTDGNLLSDYRFLEDAGREANNAQRDFKWKGHGKPHFVEKLGKKAMSQGIQLRFMPYPMTKRKNNKTRLVNMRDWKNAKIVWDVEWVFPQSDLTFKSLVDGEKTLAEALLIHMHPTESEPTRRHILRHYVSAGSQHWRLFIKKEGLPANQPVYDELDQGKTLTENLSGKTVIEYPTVHVVLKDFIDCYKTKVSAQMGCDGSSNSDGNSSDSSSEDNSEDNSDNEDGGVKNVIKKMEDPPREIKAIPKEKNVFCVKIEDTEIEHMDNSLKKTAEKIEDTCVEKEDLSEKVNTKNME